MGGAYNITELISITQPLFAIILDEASRLAIFTSIPQAQVYSTN